MEVIILGSGTGIPSLKRGGPGVLVIPDKGDEILLDIGLGTLHKLIKVGIRFQELKYLFITHFHPDHVHELPALLFANKYAVEPRKEDLHIIGPKGLKDFFTKLEALYGQWIKSNEYRIFLHEAEDEVLQLNTLGRWQVKTKPTKHIDYSIGYRIEDESGKSIVYPGDTDYAPTVVELSRGCDLLLLESSFPEGHKIEGHLTPSYAGRIAQESGCRRLVIVHIYPVCDGQDLIGPVKKYFQGESGIGEDLMKISL